MSEKSYQVETGDVRISRALQGLANSLDWNLNCPADATWTPWLVLYPKYRNVYWNKASEKCHQTIGVVEAVRLLKAPKPLTVGGLEVEFHPGRIKIGHLWISRDEVDEIHRRMHEENPPDSP